MIENSPTAPPQRGGRKKSMMRCSLPYWLRPDGGSGDGGRGTRDEGRETGVVIQALASGYAPEPGQEENDRQTQPASGSMLAMDNGARRDGRSAVTQG